MTAAADYDREQADRDAERYLKDARERLTEAQHAAELADWGSNIRTEIAAALKTVTRLVVDAGGND